MQDGFLGVFFLGALGVLAFISFSIARRAALPRFPFPMPQQSVIVPDATGGGPIRSADILDEHDALQRSLRSRLRFSHARANF
jgi:hypothetical protein